MVGEWLARNFLGGRIGHPHESSTFLIFPTRSVDAQLKSLCVQDLALLKVAHEEELEENKESSSSKKHVSWIAMPRGETPIFRPECFQAA